MATMKEIKDRIKSISDTQKITNAMYLVASAKLRSGKEHLGAYYEYQTSLEKQTQDILSGVGSECSVYLENDRPGKTACLVIGSDKGLAGDYNKAVFKEANNLWNENKDIEFYIIGARIKRLLEIKHIPYNNEFVFSIKNPDDETASYIRDYFDNLYLSGNISGLIIIYTDLVNGVTTKVVRKQVLPICNGENTKNENSDFIPFKESIISTIIPLYFKSVIRTAVTQSFCSEQNCRMTAMQASNDSAKELLADLKLQYNHQRQNAITREITEISGERNKSK